MSPPDPDLRVRLQTLLGTRFVVGDEVGAGGFAHVFEAVDTHLQSRIAVKVLRPELVGGSGAEDRFLREARILAELRHPHIVPILDIFQGNGLLAYLMPLVIGPTLDERLARTGALPLDEAVRILTEVGEALDFAHRSGKLHRDLKPSNILLSGGHALLSDFGIARAIEGWDGPGLTETGQIVGSAGYMSPEQASGSARVDARSDLHSLGVIGYEMIAGQKPFAGGSPDSRLRQQLLAAPTSLSVIRASVPAALDATIARALSPNPADRFATAAEFATACRVALESSGPSTPAVIPVNNPAAPTISSSSAGQWRKRALAAIAILSVAAGLAWMAKTSLFAKKSEPLDPGTRAWFVVAQVATRPEDPRLAAAIRTLLASTLGQSSTLGALTDQEIAGVLRSAGKAESSVVDPTLAREVASRATVRGVLEASVDRADDGSILLLKAIDTERDSTLALLTSRVARNADILAMAEKMAIELRLKLEENANALASQKMMGAIRARTVITANFRAWKIARLAGEQGKAGDDREAVALFREAVALDSTFIWGWNGMSVGYANLGYRDSAVYALSKVLLYPEKLPNTWGIEAALCSQRGDYKGMLRLVDRMIQATPGNMALWNDRGNALTSLARHEEALESYRKALDLAPQNVGILGNTVLPLNALGRTDDAEALLPKISIVPMRQQAGIWIALARADEGRIESASRALLALPDVEPGIRRGAHAALASRLANRGELADATQELAGALLEARQRHDPRSVAVLQWAEAALALAYGRASAQARPARAGDQSLDSRITEAVNHLVAGNPREARVVARSLERAYADQPLMLERAPDLIDAWAASLEDRPRDVIRFARRITDDSGCGSYFAIRKPVATWLLARAYEELGERDSAATYYERALSTRNLDPEELVCSALFRAPARQRLALVELRRGHTQEARAQAEQFVRMFDRPDPAVRPLLDELQNNLALSGKAAEPAPRKTPALPGGRSAGTAK